MTDKTETDSNDPEAIFARVVALRHLADQLERQGVLIASKSGWSWARIALALGVSRQAAHKRLKHLTKGK